MLCNGNFPHLPDNRMLDNSSTIFYYDILIYTGKPLMPKDLIIEHLAFGNFLSIVPKGIRQTLPDFGFKDFLDAIGYKQIIIIYTIKTCF